VAAQLAIVHEVVGSIPGESWLSEFQCDLIKSSDNTWKPIRKLHETICTTFDKPFMSNYQYERQLEPHRAHVITYWIGDGLASSPGPAFEQNHHHHRQVYLVGVCSATQTNSNNSNTNKN